MLTDLLLAIAHHLLIFILFAIIAVELVWLKRDISRDGLKRLAGLDRVYGIVAGLVVIVGISRVFYGLKGYEYYVESHSFWTKMVLFLAVGLLSIKPTVAILRWNSRAQSDPGYLPSAQEIAGIRRYLHIEATIFLLIPIFAAAMARGY